MRFIAPSNENVFTDSEQSYASTGGHVFYVTNRSTVTIIVFGFELRECENVRGSCSPQRMNVRVKPGTRVRVSQVLPKNPEMGMSYRSSFSWKPDAKEYQEGVRLGLLPPRADMDAEAGPARPAATATGETSQSAASPEAPRAPENIAERLLDLAAVNSLGARIASMRVFPDSVPLKLGQSFLSRQVTVIAFDSSGVPLGRVVALRWRADGDVLATAADTVFAKKVGRGMLEFRLAVPDRQLAAFLPVVVLPDTGATRQ